MEIEYDEAKRKRTLDGRGLDMARAAEVFDSRTITEPDDRKDYGEARWVTFGTLDRRMVILIWTEREGRCRIISIRKANEREQARIGPRLG